AALPDGGKLAGLDVGSRTVGLAVSDACWHFAGPCETIRRTKFTKDLEALTAFVAREHIVGLVVGLPLNMDGSDSPRTQSVRAFARNPAPLALTLLLWDARIAFRAQSTRWPIFRTTARRQDRGPDLDRRPERPADRWHSRPRTRA